MATSSDVANHAGVSRSTVSQIFNGNEELFAEETVTRVRAAAHELGYRPSIAGRSLRRGRSDIVITLIPDVTFNTRVRELVDTITDGLSEAGFTNLLQIAGRGEVLRDAVVDLRPYGLVTLTPLPDQLRERLRAQGVRIIEQSATLQAAIDHAIGRLQAQHLAEAGYRTIAVVAPTDTREQSYATPRDAGVREWGQQHGLTVLPTVHISLDRSEAARAVRDLPAELVGIAAYNDEIALSILGAALAQGRAVPDELGIVGIDNTPIAHASTPSIASIDYDMQFSAQEIVRALLSDTPPIVDERGELEVERRLNVVPGGTTRREADRGDRMVAATENKGTR